jgi:hypothetical protein
MALRLASLAPFDFAQGAPSLVEGLRAFDSVEWNVMALRLALLAPFDFAQGAPSLVEGLRAFDLGRACHERTFGLPGGKRKVSRRGGSY